MENAVHRNDDHMTELNVVISVVKMTFVQTCASTFDLQKDSKKCIITGILT